MSSGIVIVLVALVVALVVLGSEVARRRPAEGWLKWFMESFRAERRGEDLPESAPTDSSFDDFLSQAEDGSGYTTLDQLVHTKSR